MCVSPRSTPARRGANAGSSRSTCTARGQQPIEYSGFMQNIGFTQREAIPCIFVHEVRGIACSVHGDDLTSTRPKVALEWHEAQLKGKYELREDGRLGPGVDDAKELTVPNRVLRYTPDGFEYEADPPQAEKLLGGLILDGNCNGR